MKRPNFLGIGVAKTGTTSMFEILRQHPQIFLPDVKEVHFFDEYYDKGLDWYLRFFDGVKNEKAIGEITPIYIYDRTVPEKISADLGSDIKLILILRNPADRAYSNYLMNSARYWDKRSFKEAIDGENKNKYDLQNYPVELHYINKGFYDIQMERYMKHFDWEKMLVLLFEEDIIKNRKKTFKNIFEFLEVDDYDLFTGIKSKPAAKWRSDRFNYLLNTPNIINQGVKKLIRRKNIRMMIKHKLIKANTKNMAKRREFKVLRKHLIDNVYKDSILNLEKILNRDLNIWYKS